MWPWSVTEYPCPVCGAKIWNRTDRIEATMCESEQECRFCHEWSHEFSYGDYRERIGYAVFEWSYTGGPPESAKLVAAAIEMLAVCRHPDYETMKREAPEGVLADWFGDHDFPIQEAALRSQLASVEPL